MNARWPLCSVGCPATSWPTFSGRSCTSTCTCGTRPRRCWTARWRSALQTRRSSRASARFACTAANVRKRGDACRRWSGTLLLTLSSAVAAWAGGRTGADYEEAELLYTALQEREPKRLEHMDVLSNILYVRDNAERLSQLAHHALEVDRFRPETCCIIGTAAVPKQPNDRTKSLSRPRAPSLRVHWALR